MPNESIEPVKAHRRIDLAFHLFGKTFFASAVLTREKRYLMNFGFVWMAETFATMLAAQAMPFRSLESITQIVFGLCTGADAVKPFSGRTNGVTQVIGKNKIRRPEQSFLSTSGSAIIVRQEKICCMALAICFRTNNHLMFLIHRSSTKIALDNTFGCHHFRRFNIFQDAASEARHKHLGILE